MKRTIRLVMGFNTMFTQHNYFYAAQVSDSTRDSTIDTDILELSTLSAGETSPFSGNSPTRETSCQSSIVPDPLPMPVALPDTQLNSSSRSAESLPVSLPSKTSAKLPEQPKKTPRKVTMDEINELHLSVLQKEKMKLDLEIENILLKKREILLRIQELESRSNLFSKDAPSYNNPNHGNSMR